MTREDVPPLLTVSGAVLATQRVRVGQISSSDRCRRPVGREKKENPRCLIFGTRTVRSQLSWHRERNGKQRKIGRRGDCPDSVALWSPWQDCQKRVCWRLEPVLAGPIPERRISSRDTFCNLINSGPWEQEQPAVRTTADLPRTRFRPDA